MTTTPRDDYITCATCGQQFDPADLGAVFEHEHDASLPAPEWTGSAQVVDAGQVERLERMRDAHPVNCACPCRDAHECFLMRHGFDYDKSLNPDEECDCPCHARGAAESEREETDE